MAEKTTVKEMIQALFIALQEEYPNFQTNDFIWRLGTETLKELGFDEELFESKYTYTIATLFGISIEVDFLNPNNLQLLWDITEKITSDL